MTSRPSQVCETPHTRKPILLSVSHLRFQVCVKSHT